MADIISRLKLESGEFDSKIKRASQELTAYSQHCRKMGLEMGYANKDAKEFAKSLGSMQTTATTARGKVSELSDAFVNLKAMYNQMTDAEKQGQFGKNLAASLDQLKQRTQQAKQELADITKELSGASNIGGGGGLFSSDKLSGMLQVFGGNLMTKGLELATGAVSKLTSEIGGMITQGIEMAKQGEGIRIAFERLGRGDILQGLREATHGTVTDLELMKAAVKFNDFKLPVEELGTMLAFAQQKAKDTGQSVDYMVDSIVTGLGRKSLMILDNLGLSANEIKEKMKQTGDMTKAVGQIIREQMAKAGDYVETAADRAAQANVSLQNKMEELGRKFAPIEEASNSLWTSMKIGILDIIGGPLTQLLNGLTEAGRMRNALNNMGGNEQVNNQLGKLRVAKAAGSGYMTRSLYSGQVEQYNRQINAADIYLKQYDSNHSAVNTVLMAASKQFGQKFDSISDLKAFKDAYVSMKNEYVKGAQEIMNVTSGAKGATTTTTTTTKRTKTGKTEQTELQKNQAKINALTQQFVDINAEASRAGKPLTDEQKNQTEEIQKQIEALKQRNGLLGLFAERAQGRLLSNDDMKRKAEIDIQVNTKQIEDLRRQLTEIEGVTIDPKTIDVNANTGEAQQKIDELKAKIAELEDKNINIKTFIDSVGKPLGEGLKNVGGVGMLDQATNFGRDIAIPSGGLQLSDKQMKAVNKSISGVSSMADGIDKSFTSAASAVSALGSAFASIEDPAAKVIGTVSQAIATVALGYATATTQAAKMGPWAWIAFAATGLATMISTISAIHSSTGYAEGGMIKGNSYSGDNLMAMGPNGLIGLNAGEIVLNKSQQNNLASQLQGSGMQGLNLTATIRGEQIRLALNNNGRRTGRGEYVQSRNVR